MKKKKYETPMIEIMEVDVADIIATSVGFSDSANSFGNNEEDWSSI